MILSPHIITGAALGANFTNPYLLPVFAFALHHLLDRIPHYEYSISPFSVLVSLRVFFDILAGIATICFIYLFFNSDINLIYMSIGAFFGALPDGLLLLSFIFKNNKLSEKYQKYHNFFHFKYPLQKTKTAILWGLLTQIVAVIVAIYFLA